MASLVFDRIGVAVGGRRVLADLSLRLASGELVVLVGPNGAGKTTLLRAGLGLLPVEAGTVRLNGADPRRLPALERARALAYLPQSRPLAWPVSVKTVVALGRFAYGAPLAHPRGADAAAIARALAACDLEGLADRATDTLSGGELARVHMARALAAQAPLLIADEPTASLDPRHAFETMAILKAFCAEGGGALVTLHDLSLAARFADRVAVLHAGRLVADGPASEALAPAILASAFGVRAAIVEGAFRLEGPA